MSRQIRLAGLSFIGLMIALVLSLVTLGGVASAQTCDTSGTKDGSASPSAVTQAGQAVSFTATGFKAGENVSFWFTAPGGAVAGTARPLCCAGADGVVRFAPEPLPAEIFVVPGKWALTVEGAESGHQSVIYFCVGAASAPPPAQQPPAQQTCDTSGTKDGSASPSNVTEANQAVAFTATGFTPNENVSFWFTAPGGAVAGTARPLCCAGADGVVRFAPEPVPAEIFIVPGKWALTVEGAQSKHQSVIYFCVGAASAPPPAQQPPAAPTATSAPAAPPAAPPAAAPPAAPPEAAPSAPTESSPTTEVLPATSAESVGMPRTGEGDNAMLVLLLTGILGMSLLGSGWLVNRKYNVR